MAQVWVKRVEAVQRPGALRALFSVEVEGVGTIEECRYMETERGAFVTGPSYKHSFARGGWAKPVTFEEEVAGELLSVVQGHLGQDAAV